MGYRDTVEEFLENMTGRTFVKNAIYDDSNKTLFINFFNSYEEYLNLNPETPHDKDTYLNYFGSGKQIEKLIVLEPARILRDFEYVEYVSISLNFEGKQYDANVSRKDLNNLIGFDIRELSPDDSSWKTKFSDVYGYGLKNPKRKELFEHFTIII